MAEVSELFDKDFEAAMIKNAQQANMNTFETNEKN